MGSCVVQQFFAIDDGSDVLILTGNYNEFFGFEARRAISATAFTVTGAVHKFLTVVINVLIWDKHASPFGLLCLLFTLAGGVLYQQSVTRPGAESVPKQTKSENDGAEESQLVKITDGDEEK
ncbi:hypothetical protein GH714_016493 [Hevea brasiliensis]|uniref:Sugar phosphate transporter domain-containing protein n=1 Tax=Hevea brasiliensis TaxID=3981 RepID=A0A6A6MEP2_HEVBR|nr:hypothetical protein GH714_016493 [Hevea brasiliensis]